jgi:mRNA-degrading endonuclease toxin of MazEF toxin-antitoxin module
VVPISSQIDRLYPAEIFIPLNDERRKAMTDQITTASRQRLVRRLGTRGSRCATALACVPGIPGIRN